MGARISSIADTLDSIISGQPHRAAQSIMVAREEIKRLAGRQFDPEIVQIVLEMSDTIWEDLTKEINSRLYTIINYPSKPGAQSTLGRTS